MKKIFIIAGLLTCTGIAAQAQDAKNEEAKGKAIVQVFGNFHTGFGKENSDRGFELERSYLGYEYKLGELVEYGDTSTMFSNPADERTKAYLTGKMG